jgi:hypothetical protein
MASLSEKAILIKVSISHMRNQRKHAMETEKVLRENGARNSAGRVSVKIIDSYLYEEYEACIWRLRDYMYKETLPWADGGYRIVLVTRYPEVMTKIGQLTGQIEAVKAQIIEKWASLMADTKRSLNGLFMSSMMPSVEDFERAHSITVDVDGIPEGKDWRSDLVDPADSEAIREKMEQQNAKKLQAAMGDIWSRVETVVGAALKTLSDPDKSFHSSLINNIKDLCDAIPSLNIADDPKINDCAARMREHLAGLDVKTIKKDLSVRAEAARKAASIMGEYFGK